MARNFDPNKIYEKKLDAKKCYIKNQQRKIGPIKGWEQKKNAHKMLG